MDVRYAKLALNSTNEAISHLINRRRELKRAVCPNEAYRLHLLNQYRLDIMHETNRANEYRRELWKLLHGTA